MVQRKVPAPRVACVYISEVDISWVTERSLLWLARRGSPDVARQIAFDWGKLRKHLGHCWQMPSIYPAGRKQATTKAAEKLILGTQEFFSFRDSTRVPFFVKISMFFSSQRSYGSGLARNQHSLIDHLAADVLQSTSSTLRKRKQAIDILDACSICFTAKPNKNRFQQMINGQ